MIHGRSRTRRRWLGPSAAVLMAAVMAGIAGGVLVTAPSAATVPAHEDHGAEHHDENEQGSHEGNHSDDDASDQDGATGSGRDAGGRAHEDHELVIHDCSGRDEPSTEDEEAAQDLVDAVQDAAASYPDVEAAEAAGYVAPDRDARPGSPVLHYWRPSSSTGAQLDVDQPDGLVYFVHDDGSSTLLGFVWRSRLECPPQPGGPLTVWHDHSAQGCPPERPDCPAASGEADPTRVPKMLHVWVFDGVEDPFAHDLPGALDPDRRGASARERPQLPFDDD